MGFKLKEEILKLLREDEEFRWAVAGLLGYSEILKRFEEYDKKFNEILNELKLHRQRLEEHDRKFNEIINRLERHDKKFTKLSLELRALRRDVSEIRTYIERTSLTLEEEAREVLEYKLRKAGIHIKLKSSLITPELGINIYGATEDLCVIGEVSTRTGTRIVDLLDEKVNEVKIKRPEYLKPRIIKVIYTLWVTDEAMEKASQRGIWLVKATEELTPLKIIEQQN